MSTKKAWYVAEAGKSIGPMTREDVADGFSGGRYSAQTLVFKQGMDAWTPAGQVPELAEALAGSAAHPAVPPPPTGKIAHEIDYEINGEEMQFVDVELDPGESAIAEAGTMMYMDTGIEMQTIFGDGGGSQAGGLMDKLVGAGKRVLTGESLFMTVFTNTGSGKQRVGFAAPYPGKVIPIDLSQHSGRLVCQKDAFLCAAKGVSIGIAFQKRIGVGLFGGEGFIMQRLEGDGLAFVHAGGTILRRTLEAGETLNVDTGCLVALEHTVDYDIEFVGGIKSAIFGGEGFFFARLSGTGDVWLQSLPFSRLADRIYQAAPKLGGKDKGEGSVLGTLAGIGGILER